MIPKLKNLSEQVVVITGASSGIGLVTARMAARYGTRLVLAARSGDELRRLADEINSRGGRAVAVAADVGNEEDVHRISDTAVQQFGGFDTWVSDAGVSIFGRIEQVSARTTAGSSRRTSGASSTAPCWRSGTSASGVAA